MARKGSWIRSSAVVTYSVSVSYQIDRSEISSELTFNAVCALRVISQQNEEIWHPSSPLPGGGSNTDNVSLLNYFGKIKTSCLDLIFFSSFVKRLSGIKCRILEGGVQSQEQFICGQVVLILSAARSSSQINSGYCLNISWY